MNDTAECDHFFDEILANSVQLLGNVPLPGLEEIIAHVRPAIRQETFVSSWCEYFDAEPNGKLSMWRSYAKQGTGVGLVVDSTQMLPSQLTPQKINFHVYSTTVDYIRANRTVAHANDALRRIASLPELSSTLVEKLQMAVFLLAKSPCIKHDGFSEEEEVRFLYMKGLLNLFGQGDQYEIVHSIHSQGTEKRFYAFSLQEYPLFDFDFRIETVLKKVVIGPAEGKEERAERVSQMLGAHRLGHVKVELCDVPLR